MKHSIRALQQETGKTAVFVTHDQSEAFAISDRIFVMNAGRIEQGGTQLDLYLHPSTPFVAEFLGSNNCLSGVVADSRGGGETGAVVSVQVGAHTFTSPSPRDGAGDARACLREAGEHLGDAGGRERQAQLLDGVVERIVFDGSTVHLHVDTDVARLLVEVGGSERLDLMAGAGSKVRLGFDDLTLIPKPVTPPVPGNS